MRIEKLDSFQPVEQAGFQKGFGTIYHLQTIRILIQNVTEYDIPIHLAFTDSDSIETGSILAALEDARVDSKYSAIIRNIYERVTFYVKIDENTN